MPRSDVIRRKIARLFISGFEGCEPDAKVLRLVKDGLGGVILFDRNLPDQQTSLDLTGRLIEEAGAHPLILCIDQEGGRVQNLGPPWLQLPPMRSLGRAGPDLCRQAGLLLGRELAASGFHLDLAPVMDVDTNPKNPIIGDRSFSTNPDKVARLAAVFARGLQEGGVGACAKHFPGHGDTDSDSHLTLPELRQSLARLREVELTPFLRAARDGMASVMLAHLRVPALAPETTSLSPQVYRFLRTEIGFGGPALTDDLEMKAVADQPGVVPAAVQAFRAGADGILICSRPGLAAQAIEECTLLVLNEGQPEEKLDRSIERWEQFAKKYNPVPRRPDGALLASLFQSSERLELEKALERFRQD